MSNARNLANLLGTKTKVKDVDVDGTELVLDADGDTSITADTDDQIDIKIGGSDVGVIGSTSSRLHIVNGDTGLRIAGDIDQVFPCGTSGADRDNAIDLGSSGVRFKDLYLGGGAYIGGTGSANYLDDYEEGTWTPAFTSSGASFSYSSQFGTYVKVGGLVQVQFYLLATASGTTSNTTTITGLPFAVANINSLHQSACAVWFTGTVDPRPLFNNSQSAITLWKKGAVAISTAAEVNNAYLVGSGTYRAS